MVLGSMGMKRIVVQVVNALVIVGYWWRPRWACRWSPFVYDYRSAGLVLRFAVRPVFQGMVNSTRFSSMNTLTLKDLRTTWRAAATACCQ